MTYNGTIEATRQNPNSGKWSALVRCADFPYSLFYPMREGEESTIVKGAKVTFETRPDNFDPNKMSAFRLRLVVGAPAATVQQAGRPQSTVAAETVSYYLPKDTSEAISGLRVENTALKIQKYIRKLKIDAEENYSPAEARLLSDVANAQLDMLSGYRYSHHITAALGSRMVVGLGEASIFETGIALHHIYGFPYIPGSAIKGCLRSFVVGDLFGGSESGALSDDCFRAVFGTQDSAGKVVFFDAYPTKCDKLELEIMNPHYSDYYQDNSGKTAPTDDQKPIPIKFYAVPEKTQFRFQLASKGEDIGRLAIRRKTVPNLLAEMLGEIGVGAKTTVGYGWFERFGKNL